jgi:hypothetical protein
MENRSCRTMSVYEVLRKSNILWNLMITEMEAREMADFEEDVGCDISAGPN